MSVTRARLEPRRRVPGTAALAATWLFLRRLRFDPAPPLAMLVLVGVTCFLFAALPRLANDFADDGLRYTVDRAAPLARNVRVVETGRFPASGDADQLAVLAGRAARSERGLPRPLRELIARRTVLARSPQFAFQPGAPSVPDVPGLVRFLALRVHSGIQPHIRLVAGRLPTNSDVRVRTRTALSLGLQLRASFGASTTIPGALLRQTSRVRLVEVALSRSTARLLRLRVGDRAVFTPDQNDAAVHRAPTSEWQPLAVQIVGLFVPKRPDASFWFGDPTLDTPAVEVTPDGDRTLVYGQALVAADQYAATLRATKPLPLTYEYRYFLDADRFDAGRLGRLRDALAGLEARYAVAGPLERRAETDLAAVLDRYEGTRSQAETLLAIAALGLLACALANVGLLGALTYDRRQTETTISRTRGASPLRVLAAQASEGVLVAAPAALAGWALALLLIDARGNELSGWLALTIGAGTVALLVAAIAAVARRPLGPLGRPDIVLTRPSPRRLALEALIAIAAALGVFLLRRRGLETSKSGFDPYLAGVPVLLGLACGIVALRLYPLPIAAAARLARRARGLVLHLGLSRAARQPDVSSAPLLVLLLALAIACFSAAMLRTLEAGQDGTGWRAVGAEVRVDAPEGESLPARLASRLEASGDVARAYVQDADVGAGVGLATRFVALDLAAYERVVGGTPAAIPIPRALRNPAPIPGSVPALVSANWPTEDFFQVTLERETVSFVGVVRRGANFPGVPRGMPFAVVPLRALERVAAEPVAPNRLYLRGASAAAVRESVRETAPRAEVRSRAAVVRTLRASPLVESVLDGFRAAIVLAALYAAVATALMTLIAARSRARDLALVRTMGGSPRESVTLAAVELAPFVAAALALGIGLGIAIPHLIAPGLDLAFFTGSASDAIAIPWLPPVVFALGVVALVTAAVLLAGIRTRRAGLDRALRIGER